MGLFGKKEKESSAGDDLDIPPPPPIEDMGDTAQPEPMAAPPSETPPNLSVQPQELSSAAPPSMPAPPPQAFGQDEFTGATVMPPQVDTVQGSMTGVVPPMDSVQPGFNIGGEAQMDMQAAGLAEQAGAAGQKQVFDHAAIGGLSKLYDSGSVIDSYVPDLVKSLDRLGRILFLFYWKNE